MGTLRVIGGKARGRKLRPVPGDTTRPITDRTKESLFNIIGADIRGASLLDLFAGTGAVGIEALSRGALFVRFIDKVRLAVDTIAYNLEATSLTQPGSGAQAEILRMDAFKLLEQTPDQTFDYIYIAPPQYREIWKQAVLSLDARPAWLSSDGWIIVQINPLEYVSLPLKKLEEFDQRRYGSTLLVFYRLGGEMPAPA